MANYNINCITKNGLKIISKGLSGSTIKFTSVAIGDGFLNTDTEADNLTSLVSQLDVHPTITDVTDIGNGKVRLGVRVSSGQAAYYIREIGIYAKTLDDEKEMLYAYLNAGNTADFIPASGAATNVEKEFNLFVIVGSTSKVETAITTEIGVKRKEFEEYKANAFVNPHLSGESTSETANINDNSTRIATTEFVRSVLTPYEILISKMPAPKYANYDAEVPWYYIMPQNSAWVVFVAEYGSETVTHCIGGDCNAFYDFVTEESVSFAAGDKVAVYLGKQRVNNKWYILSKNVTWDEFVTAMKKHESTFFADEPFMSVKKLKRLNEQFKPVEPQQVYISKDLSQNMPVSDHAYMTIIADEGTVMTGGASSWLIIATDLYTGKRYRGSISGESTEIKDVFNQTITWTEI